MLFLIKIWSFSREHSLSAFLIVAVAGMFFYIFAENEIIYDPEKGITFSKGSPVSDQPSVTKNVPERKIIHTAPVRPVSSVSHSSKKEDLHINRKKDPPEVYFKSGLEYFKNGDFNNALKNFNYADSLTEFPLYKLWKAKVLRRMDKYQPMLALLIKITTETDNSDVADDALLEMAIHYKSINDYEKSLQTLTRLIEQYPFGLSSATGEELSSIARDQRRLIRQEMINSLAILGYQKDDLATAYHQFQKENDLEITGTGTIETVSLIKHLNEMTLKNHEKEIQKTKQLEKYQSLMLPVYLLLFGTITSLFVLRMKINSRKKQLLELKHTIIELDTGKL
ncbi:MAG: hypothetical protein JW915_03030 [Chitinispirillaceae bacterium]|nr:hypothetical protein [Chitinispirillaceae bacterium]